MAETGFLGAPLGGNKVFGAFSTGIEPPKLFIRA